MSCVFGYTIGNDVSERTWQKADRGLWRAKNTDTFKPMGPWIETSVDLDKMETIVRVNGKESNRFRTNDMIFGIEAFIVEMTRYFTLWPGDVIWMGIAGPQSGRCGRDRDHRDRQLAQQICCGDGAGQPCMSRHVSVGNSSAEFTQILAPDIARWTEVARAGNIRMEQ
jgi:2-keto-4-pentenoate hydratase/2-oxohepta-3-ene-1,7-dioic acid hydratase in catechol pathway